MDIHLRKVSGSTPQAFAPPFVACRDHFVAPRDHVYSSCLLPLYTKESPRVYLRLQPKGTILKSCLS